MGCRELQPWLEQIVIETDHLDYWRDLFGELLGPGFESQLVSGDELPMRAALHPAGVQLIESKRSTSGQDSMRQRAADVRWAAGVVRGLQAQQ
jgi:hypothetical protein